MWDIVVLAVLMAQGEITVCESGGMWSDWPVAMYGAVITPSQLAMHYSNSGAVELNWHFMVEIHIFYKMC